MFKVNNKDTRTTPYFYTPWKRQKTFDFLIFSGGIEMGRRSGVFIVIFKKIFHTLFYCFYC